MNTVLCLSGDTALWLCFKKGVVIDSFKEKIEPISESPYRPCPWLSDGKNAVQLLVDCEQTEIEAHPLVGNSNTWWRQRSDKRAFIQTLATRFPQAIIEAGSSKAGLNAVLVHHVNLQDAHLHWLKHVEQSGIAICSVITVPEVVAGEWNVWVASRAESQLDTHSVIVVSVAPEFIRYTYCNERYALFTRTVHRNESSGHAEQFSQTLEHLFSSELIDRSIMVCAVGADEQLCDELSNNEFVSDVSKVDVMPSSMLGSDYDAVENSSATLLLAAAVLTNSKKTNNDDYRKSAFYTKKYQQLCTRKSRVIQGVGALALLALSFGFTVFSEWHRAQQHEQYRLRQVELESAIQQYKKDALSLTPDAIALSEVLLDKVVLESLSGLNPAIVLTTLAESLTLYQSLSLKEISWTLVESSNHSSDFRLSASSAQNIPSRLQIDRSAGAPSITKVSLKGSIVQGESLTTQQNAFNAFIEHLKEQQELSNLIVKKNPLTQFDGFSSVGTNHTVDGPLFEVQFDLNRVSDYEV